MPRSEPESELPQTRRWISRSCHSCNSKKIRCDKREPCSSCTRTGRPCVYPPSGPRKRRAKETIIADMASRISGLEKSLNEARNQGALISTIPTYTTASLTPSTTAANSDDLSERSNGGILVQKGSSSQYFNEVFISRVIEEERNIESALTPPQTASPQPPVVSPFNATGILSSAFLSVAPASFYPNTQLAVRLWKIYVDNVEGTAGFKLLHLPTDEVKVYSTINDPSTASLENLALSFAIYFTSTVTLEDPEAHVTLGQDRNTFLLQCKVGLEQAFAHGDFLDRPTMTGLHALAIYLSALRVHNRGKGIWILNGLAIRIAESLGLHRDGERLGLSPFQSEIRRRLWWHLLSRDGRSGEDYGLQNTNNLVPVSEVSLPINVDDTDLYLEMQHLPAPKEGWTTMTFSLINIGLTKSIQKLAAIAASSTSSSPPSEQVRANIIQENKVRIEKSLAHCNPVIPQQRLTITCSRFLLRKLDFVTRLQWALLQRAGTPVDFATEENLIEALAILGPRIYNEDGMLKQYTWARKAYPQYHVTMYVLWHLCVKPEGPNIGRAWEAVEPLFSQELWDESTIGFGPKSAVLVALKAKAKSVRENIQRLNPGKDARTSDSRSRPVSGEGVSVYRFEDTGSDDFALNTDIDEWPNWEALVRGFQLDSPNAFWQGGGLDGT
ncbi:uncharacterized protein BDZ99DRAFT_396642 [Mytilinidion resinicola]|uniref:Zn(2)-C6 fungal-type domain-containing protein n=1 Tax=Mytilinidion resinicola TaxID=574789 RepID=A0A6A6Y8P6_9PEZI|nr:uncharacterized protein BDZ99DRAFT_396642 [Mytilinidion resinicola]KAF2805192.1 hypothetical protein BDZ99DRAFT_396642 [Mytilinidion resinicola]